MTSKIVHSLVLDANSMLRNEPPVSTLISQAEDLYTVPAVIEEIRDATARSRIQTTLLPFLKQRVPKATSTKVITDFARRTGDLEVLSRPDIQILALAYELECERNHGDWRLRSMPGQKRTNGPPPTAPRTEAQVENTIAVQDPGGNEIIGGDVSQHPSIIVSHSAGGEEGEPQSRSDDVEPPNDNDDTSIGGQLSHLSFASTPDTGTVEEDVKDDSEGSDGEGWITPSNIKKHQEKEDGEASERQSQPKTMQVATITSDFAMQNVLLRMNLNLLSSSMQTIRQLKTWVLRCHACFYITKDMSKQFCNRCGKPTLLRTSCSTDKDGNFKVHLKKNMQWNTRGDVYSIPKPVAGSANGRAGGGGKGGWGQELILAEDQKEFVNAMTTERRRKEKDLMDEDYLPNILSGDRKGHQGKPKVGAGRNVNSRKRH